MATSPPYNHVLSAISPPYPSNAQLPQPLKRRQSDMSSSAPKRRKASMLSNASTPLHPLRQTSFPPENSNSHAKYSRSPSMDTMSLVSAVSAAKKKRGRQSKGKTNDDDASMVNGRAKSAVSALSGRKRRLSRDESMEDEEEGGEETAVEMANLTAGERTKEEQNRAMLIRCLDEDQMDRFTAWRAAKLPDAVVRRIVNQTLSQSVPVNVIMAVKACAKVFAGEIIEGARKVQNQWDQTDETAAELLEGVENRLGPVGNGTKEFPRGPLMPEHMRESLRRHKVSRGGEGVGQLGIWQLQQSGGVERFGVKIGGKRLFK